MNRKLDKRPGTHCALECVCVCDRLVSEQGHMIEMYIGGVAAGGACAPTVRLD